MQIARCHIRTTPNRGINVPSAAPFGLAVLGISLVACSGASGLAPQVDGGTACPAPAPMRTLYDNPQGLGAGTTVPVGLDCAAAYLRTGDGDLRSPFETGVSQVVIAPGFLGSSWVLDGDRYYCSGSTIVRQPASAPLPATALPGQPCAVGGWLTLAGDFFVQVTSDDQGLKIDHLPLGGGSSRIVYERAMPASPRIGALAANATLVVWVELDPQTGAVARILRLPSDRAEPEEIAGGPFTIGGLVLDGDRILLVETDLQPADPTLRPSRIVAIDSAGRAVTLVDGDSPDTIAATDGFLYWTYRKDCQMIYSQHGGQSCAGGVARIPLAGGDIQRLVTTEHIPWGLAVGYGALVYGDRDNDWQHFSVGPVRLFVAPLP